MSDLDTVLERLLLDPAFRAELTADPDGSLAGYRLTDDDRALLRTHIHDDGRRPTAVETRISKSGMVGLLGELTGMVDGGPTGGSGGGHLTGTSGGSGAGAQLPGSAQPGGPAQEGFGPISYQRFGPVTHQGFGPVDHEGFGPVAGAGSEVAHGSAFGTEGAMPGGAVSAGHVVSGGAVPDGAGGVASDGAGSGAVPAGYHPHVDADGDGHWDRYVTARRSDGGVDIIEDRNHDGLIDFVGHDHNADGIIDDADYDENFDGVADTHMADVNGDGWMDTRTPIAPPSDK